MKVLKFLSAFVLASTALIAQAPDESMHSSIEYRLIGPFRGGRSAAVTGISGQPNTFFFGAAGGGVGKPPMEALLMKISRMDIFGGSIGSVSVAESDPNVMYVGGGEKTVRGKCFLQDMEFTSR